MSVKNLIRCLLSSICRMDRANERGLSTLEWILLVAAVGGLATIGVIVVRGAVDETDDRTQDQAALSGEVGALRRLQGRVNEFMISEIRTISRDGTDLDRFNVCLGNEHLLDAQHKQRWITDKLIPLQTKNSDVYSFHPVSVDLATASKFKIGWRGDSIFVWCRVRHKASGLCASIADETPVSDPPNDGYRDINRYRMPIRRPPPLPPLKFDNGTAPNTTHNYPLSNTFCKGRV